MRVGVDGKTIADLAGHEPFTIFDLAHKLGMEGYFFAPSWT